MKHLLFIFNALSGKALIKEKLYSVVEFYFEKDFLVTLLPVWKLETMAETISQERIDHIVCAGGDGTLNSVISQYMKIGCTLPIGYIPMGSTNDFAKTLGYDSDFTNALGQSCSQRVHDIDVGRFNEKYFVYVAAFGSLAEVSYDTPQDIKNQFGYLAYMMGGIQKIVDLKSYHVKIQADDRQIEDEFLMGLVMNSKSIGGFKNPLSDMVELDDGKFEVILIKTLPTLIEAQQLIADILTGNLESERFIYFQAESVVVESEPMNWTLDGEFGGKEALVDIKNCARAVRFVY